MNKKEEILVDLEYIRKLSEKYLSIYFDVNYKIEFILNEIAGYSSRAIINLKSLETKNNDN